MYILSLFPLEITNIVAGEINTVENNYDYIKYLLLKRYTMRLRIYAKISVL